MHSKRRSPRPSTPNCRKSRSRRRGFTLLELLLVLAIIVIIGGLVGGQLIGQFQEAKGDASKAQMQLFKKNIDLYQIRVGGLPESLESLKDGPSDPNKKAKWRRSIMDEIPKDAWENDFKYSVKGNTYEIRSAGEDGQVNTDDDIVVEGS
ncbi:MAG: type II secretion system protein GspG [Planctomycetota bacterium]